MLSRKTEQEWRAIKEKDREEWNRKANQHPELLDLIRDMEPYLSHPSMDCKPLMPCQCGLEELKKRARRMLEGTNNCF